MIALGIDPDIKSQRGKILYFLYTNLAAMTCTPSIGGTYYPCQILSQCNSNKTLDYFKRNFHIRFAAINQFKNVCEPYEKFMKVYIFEIVEELRFKTIERPFARLSQRVVTQEAICCQSE